MILLAEAYTLGQNEQRAIDIYEKLVLNKIDKLKADIYRKLAPLYNKLQ
jgi:hypothetical protein